MACTLPCTSCAPHKRIYWEHECFANETSQKILGNRFDFCEALFHVHPTPEFQIAEHGSLATNMRDGCRPYVSAMIVIAGNKIARYSSCTSKHAEQIFIESETFQHYIKNTELKCVTFFMKTHPCHHSTIVSRCTQSPILDKFSCTLLLIDYYEHILKPRGIQLHIHVASLNRAVWKNPKRQEDIQAAENSRLGLKMMLRAGILILAFQKKDWLQVATLCEDDINEADLLSPTRQQLDCCIHNFLHDFNKTIHE